LGVQLFTVRDQAVSDLVSVLKQIREIGYSEIETYTGLYKHSAPELRRIAEDAGLRIPSGYFDYDGFDQHFAYAKDLGLRWMVCPSLPGNLWESLDGFRLAAKRFNEWGRRAQQSGMRFAFHNHNYEFRDLGGKTGYDVLVQETDPHWVFFEVDCYWIVQAGQDLLRMLQHLGKRVRLLHLKDREPGFPASTDLDRAAAHFTEVGHGSVDWRTVLSDAERLQVEHYYVQQDETPGNPIDSIRSSYEYLRTIL
jgi:sugar phosphate isomerase/epimerase